MSDSLVVFLEPGAGEPSCRLHDPTIPLLRADDLGVVRGDGCFETLLLRGGRTRGVEPHLERLCRSAAMLDLTPPPAERWREAITLAESAWAERYEEVACEPAEPGGPVADEAALRLVCTRGPEDGGEPTAYLTVTPLTERIYAARRDGIAVVGLERGYAADLGGRSPWQLLGAKTLSYAANMAALREAAARGADDVIYLSSEGNVLEGPRSTVVLARGRTLLTPPAEHGVLPGTTVAALFTAAAVQGWTCRAEPLLPVDLLDADGVWLLGSVTGAARVRSYNGAPLADTAEEEEFRGLVFAALED